MIRTIPKIALLAIPLMLAACGPSQDQIEESIRDHYAAQGIDDIDLSLTADDDGGYTGHAEFTDPESGIDMRVECTVEAAENNQSAWECLPSTESMEAMIVASYAENGGLEPEATLSADGDRAMTGHVSFTDAASGRKLRHNCSVAITESGANWNCTPQG